MAGTALQHLGASPRPNFRKDHTLLPLTRWGWIMPFDVRIELADKWGYALEFGESNATSAAKLDDPESAEARLCALTASDPKRYPLCVLVHRACTNKQFQKELPQETWCRTSDGNLAGGAQWKAWSPEAPDAVFQKAGQSAVKAIDRILSPAG